LIREQKVEILVQIRGVKVKEGKKRFLGGVRIIERRKEEGDPERELNAGAMCVRDGRAARWARYALITY